MSLLAWGATPPGILGAFARREYTPLMLRGPDIVAAEVSVAAWGSMTDGATILVVQWMALLLRGCG